MTPVLGARSAPPALKVVIGTALSCLINAAYLYLWVVLGFAASPGAEVFFWYGFVITAAASTWCLFKGKLRPVGVGLVLGGALAFGLWMGFVFFVVLRDTA